jgi:SprB repeat
VAGITIVQPAAALSLSVTQVDPACGNSNGSINLTVSGGTAAYTYLWTKTGTPGTFATSEDLTSIGIGIYNVTVTDSKGCTATLSVVLTQPNVMALSTDIIRPTCPPDAQQNGFDGAINLTVSGGTGIKTYTWVASNGGIVPPAQVNSEDLSLLRNGTYTVTVTDGNGCTATTSVTLTNINPNPVKPPTIKF